MTNDIRVHIPWEMAAPLAALNYAAAMLELAALHQLASLPPLRPLAAEAGEIWTPWAGLTPNEEAAKAA